MFLIRPISDKDSYEELTTLLHRAYGVLAAEGIKFYASHQSAEETRERAESGTCFVAELDEKIIGTITVYRNRAEASCKFYRTDGTWHFGQFAVEPALQRQGFGAAMLNHAEQFARDQGATAFACDTAETADRLIMYYTSHGFQKVGYQQWDVVKYRSVVLLKKI